MKKYIYSLFAVLLATATMTSCTEEEGSVPGNDAQPNVVVYAYTAKACRYNRCICQPQIFV